MVRSITKRRFTLTTALYIYAVLLVIFIYAPVASLFAFSFKLGAHISFPYPGFTLEWYEAFFNDQGLVNALMRSLQVALTTMAITTSLCIVTALALRTRFPGRDVVFYLIMLGIIVPGVVYGVGSAIFFSQYIGVTLSFWTILPVQVVWTLPWGLILMLARFDPELVAYEQAAAALGAPKIRVLREITFPLIFPQIMAAALFAFTLSFSELMRSLFVAGPATPTVAVLMYGVVANQPATPKFYALGTIITMVSILLIAGAGFAMTRGPGKKLF
ncbi:MAG: ABC transporter permease [Candidatus Bathyarchaeia archaeon]